MHAVLFSMWEMEEWVWVGAVKALWVCIWVERHVVGVVCGLSPGRVPEVDAKVGGFCRDRQEWGGVPSVDVVPVQWAGNGFLGNRDVAPWVWVDAGAGDVSLPPPAVVGQVAKDK